MTVPATLPGLLREQARRRPAAPAMREKKLGIWQTYSWADAFAAVKALAFGLAAAGFEAGDRLCVVGGNRPRLYWMQLAAQALGGAAVPLDASHPYEELARALGQADARWLVLESQEQLDQIRPALGDVPGLRHVLIDAEHGSGDSGIVASLRRLRDVEQLGHELASREPGLIDRTIDELGPDRVALILYQSGTSAAPRGVMLTHQALTAAANAFASVEEIRPEDEWLAYLPPGWIADSLFSVALTLRSGRPCSCPEDPGTVLADLVELGPGGFFGPRQVWEELRKSIEARAASSSWPKRPLLDHFLELALAAEDLRDAGRPTPAWMQVRLSLGEFLVYRPIRDKLGFGRCRWAYADWAASDRSTMRFFRAIGIPVKLLYGKPETAGLIALEQAGAGVGRFAAVPGTEIRLGPDSVIEVRSPAAFSGYCEDSPAGARALTADDWLRTGEAGTLDGQGRLERIERCDGPDADGQALTQAADMHPAPQARAR